MLALSLSVLNPGFFLEIYCKSNRFRALTNAFMCLNDFKCKSGRMILSRGAKKN